MVRPIKNKSVFLDEKSEKILLAAARKEATPQYPPDELMSEGWLSVVRYGDEHKYMYLNCRRAMYQYKLRMQVKRERQQSFLCTEGIEKSENKAGFWIEMLEGLTESEKATLLLYYKCKNTMDEVGRILGVTGEAIRIRLIKIYKKLGNQKGQRMKNLFVLALLFVAGCMPASQQEVMDLTNMVNQIVPAVREAVSTSSEDTKDKIEIVLGQVEEFNEAVATAETPVEALKGGVAATSGWNPYAAPMLAGIGILEALGIWKEKKKNANLEKGISRVKGEAAPELAKQIHDTIKQYTG